MGIMNLLNDITGASEQATERNLGNWIYGAADLDAETVHIGETPDIPFFTEWVGGENERECARGITERIGEVQRVRPDLSLQCGLGGIQVKVADGLVRTQPLNN